MTNDEMIKETKLEYQKYLGQARFLMYYYANTMIPSDLAATIRELTAILESRNKDNV